MFKEFKEVLEEFVNKMNSILEETVKEAVMPSLLENTERKN